MTHWTTFAVAALCVVSSATLWVNENLHGPDCPNYRYLPLWVRLPMMAWSISLAVRAFDLFGGIARGQPQFIGVSAVIVGVFQATCLSVFLAETFRGRLSSRAQLWIARIYELARCHGGRGRAMAELTVRGATVVAPGERVMPPEIR